MRPVTVVTILFALSVPLAAQWSPVPTTAPPANENACLVYDLLNARTLMFGGSAADTWSWDGAHWTQLQPAHSPPQNSRRSMVYDMTRGTAVLYGGTSLSSTSFVANDDTWEWNGSDWTQVFPTSTPGGLANHGMSYDLLRSRVVLFGGVPNLLSWQPVGATYEYDGTTWTMQSPSTNPPPRQLPAMAYDLQLGMTVMFGGDDPQVSVFGDTWLYDGTTWALVPAVGPQPPPRSNARMVYDNARGVCILFGGFDPIGFTILNDTWEFDGVQWREVDAHVYPPRSDFGMCMDLVRGRPVLFGGRIANNGIVDDTWEFGANFATFGLGCVGSAGRPTLGGTSPQLGSAASVTLTNLPPASPVAVVVLGMNRVSWALGSLPMLLDPFGMPGCRIYVRPVSFQIVGASNGTATWNWQVPGDPRLFGLSLYQQGIALDLGVNAAGLTVSNAGTAVVGH